jgi:hypothetical protein
MRAKGLLVILFLIVVCGRLYAQPQPVKLRPMTGYNIDPKTSLANGLNFWVLTGQKKFDKLFGIAKGEPPLPDAPDFSKEVVVVIALPPTRSEVQLKFLSATRAGNYVEVYCTVKKTIPLTYTMYPLVVAALPRIPGVNTINYYEDGKLIGTAKMQ